jgi:ketosteroid isomerase-like protein
MKKMIPAVLLFVASTAMADLTDDVRCREIGFSKSVESKDIEAFRSFVDADARFVSGSILRGPEEVAADWSVFMAEDGPRIIWRPQIVEVLDDGKLALSRGPYKYTAANEEGVDIDYWGTFNSIWRLNDDGEWRVVFDAGSPAAKPPGDEVQALLEAEDNCGM